MFAQYRRSINASGAGITLRDSLNFNFRRRLSENISAGLGIRAYQTRGALAEPSPTRDDPIRDFFIDPELGEEGVTYVLESGAEGSDAN